MSDDFEYYQAPPVRGRVWSSRSTRSGKLTWHFSIHVHGRQVLYDNACVSQAEMMNHAAARVETIHHLYIAHAGRVKIPEYPTEYGGCHARY